MDILCRINYWKQIPLVRFSQQLLVKLTFNKIQKIKLLAAGAILLKCLTNPPPSIFLGIYIVIQDKPPYLRKKSYMELNQTNIE